MKIFMLILILLLIYCTVLAPSSKVKSACCKNMSVSNNDKLYKTVRCPSLKMTDVAKKIDWAVNNLITEDGWSISGYSSFTLDRNLNGQRWKFGFIGGELEAINDKNTEINRRSDHPEDFEDLSGNTMFGMGYFKEF